MKVGDLVRFKKTGVVGTITEEVGLYDGDSLGAVRVFVHGVDFPGMQNPTMFRVGHLEKVAEVISEGR